MSVALITGCSSGFGLETAVELAQRGHDVYATMRDPRRSGRLEKALRDAGVDARVLPLDVTDTESVAGAVAEILARSSRIDIVVNNAGVAAVAPVEETDLGSLRELLETNTVGALCVIQAVLPAMREQGGGHIVNVTSVGSLVAPPFLGAFAASKHALEALGEALAIEVGPFGIRVTNVAPGAYETAMARVAEDAPAAIPAESPYAERWRSMAMAHRAFMQQNPDPGEVARAIADAVEADRSPARVVVPATGALLAEARNSGPEHVRALLAAVYGV